MSGKILIFLVLLSISLQIDAGILDWFRSKPKWTKLIDKTPVIEAFYPRGLRVSIKDVYGIEVFGFHGNLNKCFSRGEEGITYGNVTKPTNGRWVFIDDGLEVKPGDALHYWIYVKMNGEEYSFSKDVQVIKTLAPLTTASGTMDLGLDIDERYAKNTLLTSDVYNGEQLCRCDQPNIPTYPVYGSNPTNVQPLITNNIPQPINRPITPINKPELAPTERFGEDRFVAPANPNPDDIISHEELLTCSFQVDSLNEVILDLLKDTNMSSKLVLVGRADEKTPQGTAFDEVHKLLVFYLELYDLGKKIKSAEYKDCGIIFEMSSIIDKKRILLRSATDMKNVPCKLLEPEVAGCKQ